LINFAHEFRGVAQLASALAWGARGRLFESDHPDKDWMRLSIFTKASSFIWFNIGRAS